MIEHSGRCVLTIEVEVGVLCHVDNGGCGCACLHADAQLIGVGQQIEDSCSQAAGVPLCMRTLDEQSSVTCLNSFIWAAGDWH